MDTSLSLGAKQVIVAATIFLPVGAYGFGEVSLLDAVAASTDAGTYDSRFPGEYPPAIALSSDETAINVWGALASDGPMVNPDRVVMFQRSTDAGRTWSAAVNVYGSHAAFRGGIPTIATDDDGAWAAMWVADNIQVARSTDDGVTWSDPVAPFDEDTRSYGSYTIASDGGATWIAAAGYVSSVDHDIHFVRSTDGGATWSAAASLNSDAAMDAFSDVSVQLAADGSGNWVAAWSRNGAPTVATSQDDGQTWTPPTTLGFPVFSGPAYPDVDTDRAGTWIVTWAAGGLPGPDGGHDRMLFVRSTDQGATWSSAAAVVSPRNDTGTASNVDLKHVGGGRWISMWATLGTSYAGTIGNDFDLLYAESIDGGRTWGAPALVNNTGRSDGDRADFALALQTTGALATDRNGTVLAAWTTNYNLNGTKGDDYDIVYAALRRDCPEQPRMDCVAPSRPGRSRLVIRDGSGGNDKLTWKWMDGDAALEDFGDPTLDASYSLCLYATVLGSTRLVFEEDAPAGAQAWTPKDGFTFEDTVGTHGSIRTLVLRPGEEGRAAISARLSGPSTGLPALPLDFASPVQVQLVNDETSACWGARFPTAVTNDPSRVKTRSE